MPLRGRRIENGSRELEPFGKAAYIIVYYVLQEEDEVVVVRIWHSREQRG